MVHCFKAFLPCLLQAGMSYQLRAKWFTAKIDLQGLRMLD
jgi:hypothetical protein